MTPPAAEALPRCLGTLGVLFLTLSVVSPASSLFIIVPEMIQGAGTGAIWALLIAGLVSLTTAYIYAELGSAFPVTGGEYVTVGRTLGPLPGFVTLVINVFNNLLFTPIISLGVSGILAVVIPDLPVVPTAMAVVLAATLCSLLNIRVNALVTGAFLLIELAALVLLILLGLLHPTQALLPMLTHPVMASPSGALVPATMPAIGTATTVGLFAISGYGVAIYFGEEMHQAAGRIARVVLLAFLGGILLEILPTAAALVGTPDLAHMLVAADPFTAFVTARGGGLLSAMVAIGVTVAILNAAIVTLLSGSRFLYSTGRDRVWGGPVDLWVAKLHPRWQSPWVATLIGGSISLACCLLSLRFLSIVSGGGLIVTYAGIALAAIVGRRTGRTDHAAYRMPLYPLAPIVTLLALAYVVWSNWLDRELGRPGLFATAAQILTATLYYLLVLRRRGWTPMPV